MDTTVTAAPPAIDCEDILVRVVEAAGAADLTPAEQMAIAARAAIAEPDRVAILERLVVKLARTQDRRAAVLLTADEAGVYDALLEEAARRAVERAGVLREQLAGAPA